MMDVRRGFSAIRDVRVIGYYSAKDTRSEKQFVVYVIEVTMDIAAVSFLIYRRYSQIAILSSKLHYDTSVGLPPKYALQPYPLTEDQLAHRYDGLRHFVEEIFSHLKRKSMQGEQHDSHSTAGLDIQVFYDFLHVHKNRPPPPLHPPLPSWACPFDVDTAATNDDTPTSRLSSVSSETLSATAWADMDGSMDSEEFTPVDAAPPPPIHDDPQIASNQLRNDVLQVESQCHALWNCVHAYVQAAQTFAQATAAVHLEMDRLAKMPLVHMPSTMLLPPPPHVMDAWKPLHDDCGTDVMTPLRHLCHEVLPDVKETFWSHGALFPTTRYEKERVALQTHLQSTVTATRAAFQTAHDRFTTPPVALRRVSSTPSLAMDLPIDQDKIAVPSIEAAPEEELPLPPPIAISVAMSPVYVWGRLPETSQPLLRPTRQAVGIGQDIAQVACGGDRLVFLTASGEVYSYSPDEKGQSFESPQLVEQFALDKALTRSVIVFVACGPQHAMAISHHGELYTWGSGEDGRLGHGDIRDRHAPRKVMSLLGQQVVQGSCGGAHTAVVTATNHLYTFGRGKHGRLGLGSNVHFHMTPEAVADTAVWKHVCCGWNFTIALSVEGQVFSWGKQAEGQCGLGYIETDQLSPVLIEALQPYNASANIVHVACGYTHTLAVSDAGELFSWGLGEYGQLGKETIYQPVPQIVDVSGCLVLDRVTRVYCGAFHSVATTEQNVLLTWGLNVYGACGLGHTTNKDTPERLDCFDRGYELVVACGHKFTIVLERMNGPSVDLSASHHSHGSLQKEEDLRRTKKLWRTRILRDWDAAKDSPLAHTLWRQGIPPSLRSKVWPLAIGNTLKITPDMYQLYRQRASQTRLGNVQVPSDGREHTVKLIHTDLPRTFPSLKLFDKSGPYFGYLREVLETYACYRPDLGYIQGMSYIAALLCLHIPTDRYLCFQCLANVMVHEHLFTFYLLNVELSNDYYMWFDVYLESELPNLKNHLVHLGIPSSMYLMNWLQTLFLQVLPLEVASRVFDCFLLDGVLFLFRTSLAILTLFTPKLMESELEEALPLLQRHHQFHTEWLQILTEDKLFETIASINTPSHVFMGVEQLVQNVYFYQPGSATTSFPRQKTRRSRYSLTDQLNGIMGGL
ncbi:Aste57867_17503 [Aphanomyces stellatus]|uniref:Aste57867_17503 protein n=1 Tax=Aphanomyces stellatus TaxID=120398 RepID=A0A485L9R6_9STRA|nr:hypothetical protein As57867_017443 [Aphanomyces stellatus]VFT94256.1 Aste57867_17503 [Aphanomyces stellatus]